MRGRAVLLLVAWVSAVAGCTASPQPSASPEPTSSPQWRAVTGTRSDGATYQIEIADETGWLLEADASPKDRPARVDFSPNWNVDNLTGDPQVLFVSWWGGQCDVGQTLLLLEEGGRLALDLDTGTSVPPPGEMCPAVGLAYRVRLTFDRDVPAESVTVTVRGVADA